MDKDLLEKIEEAARVIKKGGVCVIPTETAYGLAASIQNEKALERIYEIKKRPFHKPLLILVEELSQAPVEKERIPNYAFKIIDRFWPGPLTLLLPATKDTSRFLTGGSQKVGLRISSHPVAMELVKRVGQPVTATSANLSGMGLSKTVAQVKKQLSHLEPDYYLDAGEIPPGPPSTIVDCQDSGPVIVRPGAIDPEDILALY